MRIFIAFSDRDGEPYIPVGATTDACARERINMDVERITPKGARLLTVEIPDEAVAALFVPPVVKGEVKP
jgi:hypothetical protein